MQMMPKLSNYTKFLVSICVLVSFAVVASANQKELTLRSVFNDGGTIPSQYACSGDNKSPPLKWSAVPSGAKTLALIVKDPDAPGGTFVHWVLYNLPPHALELPENVPKTATTPQNADQGINGFQHTGYDGPCPPPGTPHHYHFVLYALDKKLDLTAGANAEDVEKALRGHVVSSTELVGTFAR
jgi:Raf kinase inhibitor-like YbhB/YbcL family protein